MTSRQLYEAVLIELNKENAPNILLEDFNYFANKAINQYINKRYNIYDINQQTTDDLRVLKATAILDVNKVDDYNDLSLAFNATYETILPSDYLHLLNCICIYDVQKTYKCYNVGDTWRAAATRLTADAYSQVLDNFWNRPSYKRPYYYIHNVNTSTVNPTNPYQSGAATMAGTYSQVVENGQVKSSTVSYTYNADGTVKANTITEGTDISGVTPNTNDGNTYHTANVSGGLPKTIKIGNQEVSNIERSAEVRYGNVSSVRLEIRYGTDNSVFKLKKVYIDYIKAPQNIRLTQEQLDYTEDKSQMLEFPDYVCQEIVNELVHIVMENISDPKLQTHPVVSQSIANPAQQQTETVAQAQ